MLILLYTTTKDGDQQPILINMERVIHIRQVDTASGLKSVISFLPRTNDQRTEEKPIFADESLKQIKAKHKGA